MNIILFGPPGAGKGTQADNLVKNLNLYKISTGDLLRDEVKRNSILGKKIKIIINKGKFVPDDIINSFIEKIVSKKEFYNRLIFAYPDRKLVYYDKKHLFTFSGENKMFKSGNKNILINYLGWNIRPLVCYDLRFPVWSRNTDNFDLVLYVANWPKTRINAWDSLLKARAIENMSYSLGVNRTGKDANDLIYPGHSSCYDFLVLHYFL